jgi:glucans biosynthesis protein C
MAVFLVFVVHIFQVFSPMGPWHIQDRETSLLLGQLTVFVAPWLMPLFMLLAGSGTWYSLRKRPGGPYLGLRFRRIGVPLVAGTLMLVPIQMYFHRLHQGAFQGSILAFYPRFFNGLFPQGNFSYGHLWFLAYLLLYSALTLPLFRWLEGPRGRRELDRLVRWMDRPGGPLLLTLPFSLPLVAFWSRYPMTGGLWNDWAVHGWLLVAFVGGYIMLSEPRMDDLLRRRWSEALLPAAISSLFLVQFAMGGNALVRLPSTPGGGYLAFWTLWGIGTGSWLIVILGLAWRWLDRRSSFLEEWGDTAYPFYIFHQPAVVATAYFVIDWPVSFPLRVMLLFVLSLGATLLAVAVIRRITPLGRLFALHPSTPGPRRPTPDLHGI